MRFESFSLKIEIKTNNFRTDNYFFEVNQSLAEKVDNKKWQQLFLKEISLNQNRKSFFLKIVGRPNKFAQEKSHQGR
jgi:hypothetical protein